MDSQEALPPLRRRLTAGLLVPVATSLVVTAAATLASILWSAQGVDQRSLDRQIELARHVIATQLSSIPREQENATLWDDAILHTKGQFDYDWVTNNLGVWIEDFFGHSQTMVLDAGDNPVYANAKGIDLPRDTAQSEIDDFRPLLAQLRRAIAAGGIDAYADGTAPSPPRVSDLLIVNGQPSVVSVVPIVSDSGNISQDKGTEFLHVSMVYLDEALAARLGAEYLIDNVAFTGIHNHPDDRATVPLTNASGRFVAFIEWDRSRPGQAMLNQTVPALAGAFLVAALIAFGLIDQLSRKSLAIESSRKDAEHQARHDALTGLPNRLNFDAGLSRALRGRRINDQAISVLMLDLDRFKQVNDTLGHRAGDDLIHAVGQRLRHTMLPGDLLARLGGDEFAILHRHTKGLSSPLMLSHRIIEALSKPFEISGSEAFVGVSIGIALAEPSDTDGRELTRRADIALFEAKATGRNRAVVFEEAMSELLHSSSNIEAELREALKRTDQLSVAFQPLYRADTLEIVGLEALARWHHPKLGQISPAHFIPIAESSGLIEALGDFVLQKSAGVGARWPNLTIAVNVSPAQLRNPQFCENVFARLQELGMRPEKLEVEITEGILLEDAHAATAAIGTLRAAGVHIALDDFGTGYSSLNYLKRYPVDRIKIDRSFVSQLAPDSASVAIVEAMVKLAHALRIDVTAEGVETEEQRATLTRLGCNVLQGFLLSPPLSLPALESLLRADAPSLRMSRVA